MPEKPPETGSCEVQPHNLLPVAAEISPFECAACDETWPPPDLNLAARSRNLVSEREHVLNRSPQNQRTRHQAPRKVVTAGGGASSSGPSSSTRRSPILPGICNLQEGPIFGALRSGACRVNLGSDQGGSPCRPVLAFPLSREGGVRVGEGARG